MARPLSWRFSVIPLLRQCAAMSVL